VSVSLVIPTIGRSSLADLLGTLDAASGPRPEHVVIVDDRPAPSAELPATDGWTAQRSRVVRSAAHGPAAARNAGWRAVGSDWVVFLDDDVQVTPRWLDDLAADLRAAEVSGAAGSQAHLEVPLPSDRPPTDAERGTAALAGSQWITADMAYRRRALAEVDGFDERFPRAYREDTDIALRLQERGHRIEGGERITVHPPRQAGWLASVKAQRGNADDALMSRLHGRDWHRRGGAAVGRRPVHLLTTAAGAYALGSWVRGRRLRAALGASVWVALTAEFAWRRISPGPRTPRELAAMTATSVAIPPVASAYWLLGLWRHRHQTRREVYS
jgi:glycosyltransferase involved in cell wall biosynthesis